jgi:hypothetical protein
VTAGFDGTESAWSLNFGFAGQYCSVWQIKADLVADFKDSGNHTRNGLLTPERFDQIPSTETPA